MLKIVQIPLLEVEDNYSYVVVDSKSGTTAVIDPAAPGPIANCIKALGGRLDYVLNTHHHWDHTGGNLALQAEFGAQVVGPASEEGRVPGFQRGLTDGEPFRLGETTFTAMHLPGHTTGHMAFYSAADAALFCGDVLFTLGCGLLFEGSPEEMWTSLEQIRALPDDTRVFCGHEYTLANAEFALHIDGENEALRLYVERARAKAAAGNPTVPSLLGDEKAANPFLRADNAVIQSKLGMEGAPPARVFGTLRRLKNEFDLAKRKQ